MRSRLAPVKLPVDVVYHVLAWVDCDAGRSGADRQRPSLLILEFPEAEPRILLVRESVLDINEAPIVEGPIIEGAVKRRLWL